MLFFVIPSESEESSMDAHCAQHDKMVDASLCFASLSMTVHLAGSRVIIGSIRILFSECAFT
jgi:hypothetical protein